MLFQFQHQLYEGYKASHTNLHISILFNTNFHTCQLKASPKYTGRSRKHLATTLSLKTTQNMSEESQNFSATKQLKCFKTPKTHPPKAYQPQTNIYKSITKTFKKQKQNNSTHNCKRLHDWGEKQKNGLKVKKRKNYRYTFLLSSIHLIIDTTFK